MIQIHPDLEPLATDVDTLQLLPGNPRKGDVEAVKRSYSAFGQRKTIVARRVDRVVIAGNHQLLAARALGWAKIAVLFVDDDELTAKAYALADNRTAELGTYDDQLLADMLGAVSVDLDLMSATSFGVDDLAALLKKAGGAPPSARLTDDDAIPPVQVTAHSKRGDIWLLGPHRVMCGDSTSPQDVAAALDGASPVLVHADPPYGMGKEADGVLNDNLYRDKLDDFQMAWWAAWLPNLTDNAAAYIWGQADDLTRLWWRHLEATDLVWRNEIVWNKTNGLGMGDAQHHSFPTITERCLFLMRGEQFLGNQNKDQFWAGYEPLRLWLAEQVKAAGWTTKDVNTLTKTQMGGHWLSQSQFIPISRHHYQILADAAAGRAFTRQYDELFDEIFPGMRAGGNEYRRDLAAQMRETRSFFDCTHDPSMSDLWTFSRVQGEERFGHATPKPVAMVERAMMSASRPGDVIAVPFGGTGPEFIAAEHLGRVAIGVELAPVYVDVICRRYQEHTGQTPILAATGKPHDFTKGGDASASLTN